MQIKNNNKFEINIENINNLHNELISIISKNKNHETILLSTTFNNALFPVLNYIFKGVEPTEQELEFTLYMIEHYQNENKGV